MSNNKMTNKEMLQQIMNTMGTINSRLDSIESRVSALETSKKPSVSGKGGIQTTKEKDTRTWSEKKSEWASQKYTEAERKAYGEQKRAERETLRAIQGMYRGRSPHGDGELRKRQLHTHARQPRDTDRMAEGGARLGRYANH